LVQKLDVKVGNFLGALVECSLDCVGPGSELARRANVFPVGYQRMLIVASFK
jgi:hypothetical protein